MLNKKINYYLKHSGLQIEKNWNSSYKNKTMIMIRFLHYKIRAWYQTKVVKYQTYNLTNWSSNFKRIRERKPLTRSKIFPLIAIKSLLFWMKAVKNPISTPHINVISQWNNLAKSYRYKWMRVMTRRSLFLSAKVSSTWNQSSRIFSFNRLRSQSKIIAEKYEERVSIK